MTSEILSTRYQLHRRIVERTDNFLWLLDTNYSLAPGTEHPLDFPDCKTVQYNSSGHLIISFSSISRLATVESLLYMGSSKSWLIPLAQFSMMNPEKCRRLVSNFSIFNCYCNSLLSSSTLV